MIFLLQVTMTSPEEPAEKRARKSCAMDFELCLKCQSRTAETLSQPFQSATSSNTYHSTYTKFLSSVHARAKYCNSEFVTLSEKLHGLTSSDLAEKKAKWHRSCYSQVTNKQHLERDQHRYTQACATSDISRLNRKRGRPSASCSKPPDDKELQPKRTRSHTPSYDKTKCFFWCRCWWIRAAAG